MGDIQTTIRQYSFVLDWDALTRTAAAWRVTHAVSAALTLAAHLLAAGVPDDVLERFRPPNLEPQLLNELARQMLAAVPETNRHISPWFWTIWTPGPVSRKIAAAWRLICPPSEFVQQKYPRASTGRVAQGVAYLARLKEHARLYGGIVWNILRNDPHTRRRMRQQQLAVIRDWLTSR